MRLEKKIAKQRQRRQFRVRNRVRATGRPRLTIFRSNKHIYAQIIDDVAGVTLVSASTAEKDLGGAGTYQGNCDAATRVGETVAQRAAEKGIKEVAFDRGSYRYHGRVAALAEAARKGGLDF
ncbi:MAG: 50S ribosomal protein L18 [Maioricimonas sp. JB045]|uniref:50S ribosomal protein L18 n=1 Tax=Maioricimonas sp. JC845 TaxID=3232138 RepID=UPI00345A8FAA